MNLSKFQLILLGAFAAAIVVSVIIFSVSKGTGGVSATATVWGTIDESVFKDLVDVSSLKGDKNLTVTYRQFPKATLLTSLTEALAIDEGPDVFFIEHEDLLGQKSKIYTVPFSSYPERVYKDDFVQASEVFLDDIGVVATPFLIDPLVMYWNRNILQGAGVSVPPSTWDDFFGLSEKVTIRDDKGTVSRSAVALGEFDNIKNAEEILSAMFMQTGNPIVTRTGTSYLSTLGDSFGFSEPPAISVIRYYVDFANPSKIAYSWNRSFSSSYDRFVSGDLAIYFGKASEIRDIQAKNPNLNFDVTTLPQLKSSNVSKTYANIVGLAISKRSKNLSVAFQVAYALSDKAVQEKVEELLLLPSVRRDLAGASKDRAFMSVFSKSALISYTWLEPDSKKVSAIFKSIIENIITRNQEIRGAVGRASLELTQAYVQ